jgi:hypothetical protein
MFISAANPAGLPQVSLCIVGLANESAPICNGGGDLHAYCHRHANSERALILVACSSLCAHETFAFESVCRVRARLRGFSCALRQLALLLRPAPPCGLWFPSKSCSERTPKRFLVSLRICRASALGSMPHSLNGAPITIGKFNKRRRSCIRTK